MIYWQGPGSKTNGMHTRAEFLTRIRAAYPEHVYWRMRGDTCVPPGKIRRNDLDSWLRFGNARLIIK